jgi:hypothetical protein
MMTRRLFESGKSQRLLRCAARNGPAAVGARSLAAMKLAALIFHSEI